MHAPRVRRTVGVLPDAFRAYEYVNMDPPRETKSGSDICTPTYTRDSPSAAPARHLRNRS